MTSRQVTVSHMTDKQTNKSIDTVFLLSCLHIVLFGLPYHRSLVALSLTFCRKIANKVVIILFPFCGAISHMYLVTSFKQLYTARGQGAPIIPL